MITPGIGLVFWMGLTFLILMFFLGKFAWKPIMKAVNDREASIIDALNQAKLAREEMQHLKTENDRIVRDAKLERDAILKEARDIKDRIVEEAREIAKEEGEKMISLAKLTIEAERKLAMEDVKSQISDISVNIAEKILIHELETTQAQNELVRDLLSKTNLN